MSFSSVLKHNWFFGLSLLLITLLRLRVASQFGLGVDEAHYALYGQYLDWSYFDHPPLVGWTQALFQLLPINPLVQVRLSAILIAVITSKLALDYLISKNIPRHLAALSVVALNLTPMFNAMSIALLPDTLLMPLTFLIITSTENLLRTSNLKNWCLLGLWLGLAGLAKYTSVVYILALVLIFAYNKKLKELLNYRLWIGVLISFVLIAPILYWNLQNDFASFQYQADHVLKIDTKMLSNFASSVAIQMVSWGIGPFWSALIIHGVLLKKFRQYQHLQTSLIFASVFLGFFIYVSLAEVLLPHWMLIYFILMIPVAYSLIALSGRWKKINVLGGAFSALLTLTLLFELGFKIFPAKWMAGAYEGIYGWEEIMSGASEKLNTIPVDKKGLAVMNWTLGSRAMYYNKSEHPVFVIDNRQDQFDIWMPEAPLNYDLIVVIEARKKDEHTSHLNCSELTLVGQTTSLLKNVPVNEFLYYHCANFLGYK